MSGSQPGSAGASVGFRDAKLSEFLPSVWGGLPGSWVSGVPHGDVASPLVLELCVSLAPPSSRPPAPHVSHQAGPHAVPPALGPGPPPECAVRSKLEEDGFQLL